MIMTASSRFPKVAIVVLNYQGKECLARCLSSLEKLSYPARDILVIDNASTDGSLELARERFPHFTYRRLPENRGFAGGMNEGIRLAREKNAAYYWLFNNDARAESESLTRLIAEAEAYPSAGLLSPLVRTPSGALWFAAARVNFSRMRVEHQPVPETWLNRASYPSPVLSGCALLVKKETVEKIGMLDEAFFLYYEDADYSLRAGAAGLERLVVPASIVWHEERSEQNKNKTYFLVYSGLLFFRRHTPPRWRMYLGFYVTIRRIKNAFDRLRGKEKAFLIARAYRAYFHSSRTFFGQNGKNKHKYGNDEAKSPKNKWLHP